MFTSAISKATSDTMSCTNCIRTVYNTVVFERKQAGGLRHSKKCNDVVCQSVITVRPKYVTGNSKHKRKTIYRNTVLPIRRQTISIARKQYKINNNCSCTLRRCCVSVRLITDNTHERLEDRVLRVKLLNCK